MLKNTEKKAPSAAMAAELKKRAERMRLIKQRAKKGSRQQ
jgi:hypothetical protein